MVFYMLTCFNVLKSPILHVIFLQNLPTKNNLDPIFYRTLFYYFRLVISPGADHGFMWLSVPLRAHSVQIYVCWL